MSEKTPRPGGCRRGQAKPRSTARFDVLLDPAAYSGMQSPLRPFFGPKDERANFFNIFDIYFSGQAKDLRPTCQETGTGCPELVVSMDDDISAVKHA